MELILHIGMPKTGTTAIQMALHRARGDLARQGVLYPDLGVLGHAHHALMPLFLDHGDWWNLVRTGLAGRDGRAWAGTAWDGLVARARETGARQVVLSTEALFAPLDPALLGGFAARLRAAFESIRVVAYVRPPALYFDAILLERAKRSLVPPQASGFQYRTPIEQFETALDLRADIRLYDRAALVDGDAVADFCTTFLDLETRPGTVRSNRSPRPETLEVYQAIMSLRAEARKWLTDWDMLWRMKALEEDVGLPEARARIRPEVADWIACRHRQDTAWLEADRDLSLRPRPVPEDRVERPIIRALHHAFDMDDDVRTAVLARLDAETGLPDGTRDRLREMRDDPGGLIERLPRQPKIR